MQDIGTPGWDLSHTRFADPGTASILPRDGNGGRLTEMGEDSGRHHIIVAGGGAGGLELAARLGDRLARRGRADVTLIDSHLSHVWKPLLHEVAAGTLDSHEDDMEFLAQARWHHLRFRLGRMDGLDRQAKEVHLAPILNEEGAEVVPRRRFRYDTLVLAVGSVSNDFRIEGAREHCVFLDDHVQADRFHRLFLESYLRAQTQPEPPQEGQLNVGIVGAGATGVELAAELHRAGRRLVEYGLDRIAPERDMKLVIVEAADRILSALPERISRPTEAQLRRLGVQIHTGERVTRATEEGLHTSAERFIPCRMKVWAAGIKAPDFLAGLGGLETNRLNQLVVRSTLQTTRDEDVFAFGDCAECPRPGHDRPVPPRAQAAHQQAALLAKTLERRLDGRPPPDYVYRDYGSLVSLGEYTTVGSLMGNLTGSVMVEGWFARLVYRALYRNHQRAVYGTPRTLLIMLKDWLQRRTGPRMKLH